MTIRPGAEWGRPAGGAETSAGPPLTSDADVAKAIRTVGGAPPLVRGGDLFRTVGAPGASRPRLVLPVDLLRVEAGGREYVAVAHAVARRRGRLGWWRGPVVAAMNVEYLGSWDVAPRAHPNDGRVDCVVVDEAMSMRARWQARRRLPTGTHLPHPSISVRRTTGEQFAFDRPVRLWVDGVDVGPIDGFTVTVDPDAGLVIV